MNLVNSLLNILKRYFVSGVLVVVPIILTYIVLRFLFEAVDGILQPLLLKLFGYYVPGLGVVTTLLLIILAGVLTRNLIGARLYSYGERLLVRLPLVRPIYSSAKQLLQAMTASQDASFNEVGLVVYPRVGSYSLCFVANRVTLERGGEATDSIVAFIPSTPTPLSGMVVVVPRGDVMLLDMTVEEGVKFLVSGGVASPKVLRQRPSNNQPATSEV
ncbi:DUF502 domain-containing protein [candidate division GN15 bacterium]|nr:DUF502 domain-containing protein [candidate division GN15 bacterium]